MFVNPLLPFNIIPDVTPSPKGPTTDWDSMISWMKPNLSALSQDELRRCLQTFTMLSASEQVQHMNGMKQILQAVLASNDVAFGRVFVEEMPEELLCTLFEKDLEERLVCYPCQERSVLCALIESASRHQYGRLLGILLNMFLRRIESGACTTGEAHDVAKILLESSYFLEGIDYVVALPENMFWAVMHDLHADNMFFKPDAMGRPCIVSFFNRASERVLLWMVIRGADRLLQCLGTSCATGVLSSAARGLLQEAIKKKDFPFLLSLLSVYPSEGKRGLIASISNWGEEEGAQKTNFLYWLFERDDPRVDALLPSLLAALPFHQLASLWEGCNEALTRPEALNSERFGTLLPDLTARVEQEWRRPSGLSFQDVPGFFFFMKRGILKLPRSQFQTALRESQDYDCKCMEQYYEALENGRKYVDIYQKEEQILDDGRLLELAWLFTRGPDYFPRASLLRRTLGRRLRDAIYNSECHKETALKNYNGWKVYLQGVVATSFNRNLNSLEGKKITLENMEFFRKRKLSLPQLERAVQLMEQAEDERVRNLLPAWRSKLDFWHNFGIFVSQRKNEAKITLGHIQEVMQHIHGMDTASLTGSGIHITDFAKLFEPYGDEISRRIGQRFFGIFNAILKYPSFEVEFPPTSSILLEAYFIEVTLPALSIVEDRVFSRAETGLQHLVQYNPKTRLVYLLARRDRTKKLAAGAYKIATPALALSQDDPRTVAERIRLFTSSPSNVLDKSFLQELDHMHSCEIEILRHFRNWEGVNHCDSIAEYSYPRRGIAPHTQEEVPRKSLIMEPGILLRDFLKENIVSLEDKVQVICTLSDALGALHKEGVIHGDLKASNVVMVQDTRLPSASTAQLIDFGFSWLCEAGKPVLGFSANMNYNRGIYGSIRMTPPELLGVRNFSGDHFKVESYALGFIMYRLIYGGPVPWGAIPQKYFDQGLPKGLPQQEAHDSLYHEVDEWTRETLSRIELQLLNNHTLTHMESCEKVVAYLLHPDPNVRWSVTRAKEELEAALLVQSK